MKIIVSFAGSSNSQDSFPSGPGPGMDGFGYGYGGEYGNQRGPPAMQGNPGKCYQFQLLYSERSIECYY